jgi:hypothetical protein
MSAWIMIATALAVGLAGGEPTIHLTAGRFEVVGLSAAELKPARWQDRFAVYVGEDRNRPAVAGTYRVEDGVLRFTPRFPLVPGVRYRAVLRRAGGEVRADFELPKPKPAAATMITHVYPSRDTLPENQLKFYLHFSAPMSRGQAYRHIRLLNEKGKPVELPFLELDEELWDLSGARFTLFFDPGRIKRGLKPREEVGPALVEGKQYTLVIDRGWEDASGNALKETYRKAFRVTAPQYTPPDPKEWKIEAPAADAVGPLTVCFRRPLDHALLERLLWVTGANGKRVPGTVAVIDEETRWQFTPRQPWRAGRYDLVVDTSLEDLAGNSVGRPFEVDLFRPIERTIKTKTVRRSFEVK